MVGGGENESYQEANQRDKGANSLTVIPKARSRTKRGARYPLKT